MSSKKQRSSVTVSVHGPLDLYNFLYVGVGVGIWGPYQMFLFCLPRDGENQNGGAAYKSSQCLVLPFTGGRVNLLSVLPVSPLVILFYNPHRPSWHNYHRRRRQK